MHKTHCFSDCMMLVNFLLLFFCNQVPIFGNAVDETKFTNLSKRDFGFIKKFPLAKVLGLDPESTMSTIELIKHRKYPVEVHTAITKDNYILKMHRIPFGKNGSADPNLDPILLIHGTFGFADHFLINTEENAFAYLLADAGFDVWVANLRGSEHSLGHKTLSSKDPKYWEFSWDEIAEFDLPACVHRMLVVTGRSQVFLSGHSLGGGLLFAMLASRPEYITKVKAILALAPTGNMEKFSPALKLIAPIFPIIQKIAQLLRVHELLKFPPILTAFVGKYFEFVLRMLIFLAVGRDDAQWDSNRTQMNVAHHVSSMGLNILYHLMQMINKNGFRKFDWGSQTNLKKYGQATPPDYDISNITVPSHLYYGQNDLFCTKGNVQYLVDRLPNAILHEAGSGWNHMDFIWGKYAGRDFYNYLIPFIKSF